MRRFGLWLDTERPRIESLAERERGWEREVDRHQRAADRIRDLLSELGEPCDPQDAP
jgi:hypothetical protein